MAYVLAVMTQFNQHGKGEITIKARGKAISRAVDVAEIVRNKFINTFQEPKIRISTEEVQTEQGSTLKVSSIEIQLSK